MREVGSSAFKKHWSLRSAVLNEGLERCEEYKRYVYDDFAGAFSYTSLKHITLPSTLRELWEHTFEGCYSLKAICVADGCEVDPSSLKTPNSTRIGPPLETMAGDIRVWDLRNCREVIIPEGTERIENNWFYSCDVESVTVPASVKEIRANAFRNCTNLREVIFQEGSQLKTIGTSAFCKCSGLMEIIFPDGLENIGPYAF